MERPQEMKAFVSLETTSMISVGGCVTLELLARQCAEIFLESIYTGTKYSEQQTCSRTTLY